MALHDDALGLAELNQKVVQSLVNGDTEGFRRALDAYRILKACLKKQLLDEDVIVVEDKIAGEILRKIHRNDGFQSDAIFARIEDLTGDSLEAWNISDQDIEELGSEKFYSWYSDAEYVRALFELRPLILQCETSENVKRLVDQIKNCYAFQQYDAAFGLCRTLLEASIRDICARRGLFPELTADNVLYDKFTWRKLRDRVACRELELNERLRSVYVRQCRVLHAQRAASAKDARDVFQETLRVIEALYEVHVVA